jgi:hypothetical protein
VLFGCFTLGFNTRAKERFNGNALYVLTLFLGLSKHNSFSFVDATISNKAKIILLKKGLFRICIFLFW